MSRRFVLFGKHTWSFGDGRDLTHEEIADSPEVALQTTMAETAEEALTWARSQRGWCPSRAVLLSEVDPEVAYQIGHDEGFDEGVSK